MSVGYMYPLMITQNTLKLNERETLDHIIKFLDKQGRSHKGGGQGPGPP
jgi:hypothetical protein